MDRYIYKPDLYKRYFRMAEPKFLYEKLQNVISTSVSLGLNIMKLIKHNFRKKNIQRQHSYQCKDIRLIGFKFQPLDQRFNHNLFLVLY